MEVYGIVYLIQNQINGKRYVGQTTQTLKERMKSHRYGSICVDKAISHHGIENFRYGVIKSCATKEELDASEIFYIAALYSKAPYGYNCTDGGHGIQGCSEETRKKMRAANRGENNPNYGKASVRRCDSPYKNLVAELEARQLTYTVFAELLGLSISAVSMRLSGKKIFTDKDARRLVEFFGKPIEYLLWRADGKNPLSKRKNSPYKNLVRELKIRQLLYIDLAKFLGVSKAYISSRMSGERKFTEREQSKLVEIFSKSIEYLLWRADGKNPLSKRKNSPYKNLVAELEERKFTYTAFAKLLGISQSRISSRMRDEYKFTECEQYKLVDIFGKPIEYLLARADA